MFAFFAAAILPTSLTNAGIISYQGDVWPEECGFERVRTFDVDLRDLAALQRRFTSGE